jgi:hypothetical protein
MEFCRPILLMLAALYRHLLPPLLTCQKALLKTAVVNRLI